MVSDYSVQYCHYVAGLVGIGLSRLFSASGLEGEEVGRDHQLAKALGPQMRGTLETRPPRGSCVTVTLIT